LKIKTKGNSLSLSNTSLQSALISEYLKADEKDIAQDNEPQMTLEEAIKIIQTNERGRQGRQFVKELKERFENKGERGLVAFFSQYGF
jgi:hypothetical protein